MNLHGVDLNLLVALNALLKTKSVTLAADHLQITQPAMSNALKRLRTLFNDPLLVRTSEGMKATDRAKSLQPLVNQFICQVETIVQQDASFDPAASDRVYRIAASDYAEATLIPALLTRVRGVAPNIAIDIMTTSDINYQNVEQGHVDMVINRFDELPQSFHQKVLWRDSFSCMFHKDNPIANEFNLESYIAAKHIWVSKTGMGVGVGVNPRDIQRLGWVDSALNALGLKRNIHVFTRHYQAALLMAEQRDLVLTIPSMAARLQASNPRLIMSKVPFDIPRFELTMAWSPLQQDNPGHRWFRRTLAEVAELESQRIETASSSQAQVASV